VQKTNRVVKQFHRRVVKELLSDDDTSLGNQ